jgi:hypothetical protein
MGNVYVSFGIAGFPWLLSMRLLEFQGFDNYYVSFGALRGMMF